MSANFQLCGNMPDARDALKTSLSDGAKVPAHFFKIMGCILSGPGDLRGFNSLRILLTSLGEHCRSIKSESSLGKGLGLWSGLGLGLRA